MDPAFTTLATLQLILGQEVTVGTIVTFQDFWDVFCDTTQLAAGAQIEARLYASGALVGRLGLSSSPTRKIGGEVISSRGQFTLAPGFAATPGVPDEPLHAGGIAWELRLVALNREAQGTVRALLAGYSFSLNAAASQMPQTVTLASGQEAITLMNQVNELHDVSAVFPIQGPCRFELLGRAGGTLPGTFLQASLSGPLDCDSGFAPQPCTLLTAVKGVGAYAYLLTATNMGGLPITVSFTLQGYDLRTSAPPPPAAAIIVEDEGVPLPNNPFTTLNFVGGGVVAVDAGGGVADVTIPGGGGVVVLIGDVNGPSAANVVNAINGNTVPPGPLTTGNVLQAVGAALLAYAAINLAGGPNFVTGALPAANQADQTMVGDVTGTTGANVVSRVNGATVPAAGALTPGNVLQVTGLATLGYAPVNLGGGANFVTGVLPAANQAAQTLAGDVTGTTASSVVVRVNGATVPVAGALVTGNVLQVTAASALGYAPVNLAGGANFVTGVLPNTNQQNQAMGGDVTGTTGVNVVVKINGSTVPAGGALTTGNVLQVTGGATLGYAPVNLAGGANFVTGVLPTANQAAQTMAGDVTGTTAASVVAKINGATVPAAGALTTGNVLQVNGVSSTTYAPVNLAGGANFVTGVLPTGNQAAQAMAGDVTGTTAANTVVTITGSAGVATVASATSLAFATNPAASGRIRMANNTGINARNSTNTGDIAALTIDSSNVIIVGSAGANFTARLANNGGGAATLEWEAAGTGVNGRHSGNIFFQHTTAGVTDIRSTNGQGITFTSSGSAYTFGGMLTVVWQGSGAHLLQLQNTITAPVWTHETSGSAAGATWTWRAQGAGGAANAGGRIQIQGGARTGTGLKGPVSIQLNGTTETMVEAVEVAANQRAVCFCRFANITTTELPANSGNGILFLGDATTVPTANAVTGCTIYSNTSVFSFRNGNANGGNRIEFTCVSSATANQGAAAIPALAQEFMDLTYNGNSRKIALFLP